MKTEQIFQEFEQRLEKEYYAQLASKEILTVPFLIEIFLDDDYANAHWAEQVLEYIRSLYIRSLNLLPKVLTTATAFLRGIPGR